MPPKTRTRPSPGQVYGGPSWQASLKLSTHNEHNTLRSAPKQQAADLVLLREKERKCLHRRQCLSRCFSHSHQTRSELLCSTMEHTSGLSTPTFRANDNLTTFLNGARVHRKNHFQTKLRLVWRLKYLAPTQSLHLVDS